MPRLPILPSSTLFLSEKNEAEEEIFLRIIEGEIVLEKSIIKYLFYLILKIQTRRISFDHSILRSR